jgi:hypothetical protein
MRYAMRSICWQGQVFRFQRMPAPRANDTLEWSVSCGLEFIGTMSCLGTVTTGEFDVRCLQWLRRLFEG